MFSYFSPIKLTNIATSLYRCAGSLECFIVIKYWVRTLRHKSSRIYVSINSQLKHIHKEQIIKIYDFATRSMKTLTEDDDLQLYTIDQQESSIFRVFLVLISIVGCIVALVALFLNKNKKSFRKYPVINSTFTLNTRTFRN